MAAVVYSLVMNIFSLKAEPARLLNIVTRAMLVLGVSACAIASFSCGSSPTGLRSMAPRNTLIYFETPDLGALLTRLADSPSIIGGRRRFDPSAVDGMEVAIAVSGFEASESPVTDREAVLNFRPEFTLIAETHAWSWQMDGIVRATLGAFVDAQYGAGTRLTTEDRGGDQWYVWTGEDGRKAFAAVSGSKIFFANNERGIRDCLDAKDGRVDSLMKNARLSRQYESAGAKLVFGYVSKAGVDKLSEFAGVSVAMDRSGGAGAQTVISSVFPQLIRNSVREIVWTARPESLGIEDAIDIRLEPKAAEAFENSMRPFPSADPQMLDLVPANAYSVTRYNLRDPRVAFRSLLLVSASRVDADAAKFIPLLGNSLLEPYGVADPEAFLSVCSPFILTMQFDEAGDETAAVVRTENFEALRKSLLSGFRPRGEPSANELEDPESGLLVVRSGKYVVLGEPESVAKVLATGGKSASGGGDIRASDGFDLARRPEHTVVTISRDRSSAEEVASVFVSGTAKVKVDNYSVTITDLKRSGAERTYRSAFGFPGRVVSLFAGSE